MKFSYMVIKRTQREFDIHKDLFLVQRLNKTAVIWSL